MRKREHTSSTSCELHVASLHTEEIIALLSFCAFLDHTVPVRQFAVQDVGEDLGVTVGVGWEAVLGVDSVFIEDSQTAKVLELGIVVVGEAEGMVGVKPSVISVASVVGATRNDLCVGESFGHGVFDGVDCAHGFS